jgi:hypothetical protein
MCPNGGFEKRMSRQAQKVRTKRFAFSFLTPLVAIPANFGSAFSFFHCIW